MRGYPILSTLAMAVALGLGCSSGPKPREVSRLGYQDFERVLPGLDLKIRKVDEAGFEVQLASEFEGEGEEKLAFFSERHSWPISLPASTSWQKVEDPSFEHYRAGNIDIIFKWITGSPIGADATIVNLVIIAPEGTTFSSSTVPSKSAFRWASKSEKKMSGKAEHTWVGNLTLPPYQMAVGKPNPSYKSDRVNPPVILLDGPTEDQAFVRSITQNLCLATSRPHLPVAKHGFGPFGLTSPLYFGHTFWDMDMWVLPSMLFLQPNSVRQMNQYRLDRVEQAALNAKEFLGQDKAKSAIMFPWESSVTGKETVPGPSRKQHHISGSVLWGLNLSEKAGILPASASQRVAEGVAAFFGQRSVPGSEGREIKDVMSPDENHTGDNDLFTNLLAQWSMNGRRWDGPTKFKLPRDSQSFLTYDGDGLRGYKQAAAVLSIFPLQYPAAEEQSRVMMDRFETKVIKNGPAMSDAIHATIWARLGERDRAYAAWKRAWEPFVKGPNLSFSEKRSLERTYFYTGAAGCLNTVFYGFAGFRFDEKPLPGALWKRQLKSGWWLSCKPSLPPKWKNILLNPVVIEGEKFSFEIEQNRVLVNPSP